MTFESGAPIWGDLSHSTGKAAVIGEPKTAKSFFVVQLGLHVATGRPFLGMETSKSNVLYVNFEVSEEKLQERLEDCCEELQIDIPDNFLIESIPGGLALDTFTGASELENLIVEAKRRLRSLELIIIDPRRQAMGGDENQSQILNDWCSTMNSIQQKHSIARVTVHHKGKSTTGGLRNQHPYRSRKKYQFFTIS